jgi:putative transcriptional regulator
LLHIKRRFFKYPVSYTGAFMLMLVLVFAVIPSGEAGHIDQNEELSSSRFLYASRPPERFQHDVKLSKGRFLVASRRINDPRFMETVILLLNYSFQGAMGLVINRPTEAKLSTVMPETEELQGKADVVYFGGPVAGHQLMLLLLTVDKPGSAVHIFEDVFMSSDQRLLLEMIGSSERKDKFRVYAGYAGWGPWQLDREVLRGDWLVVHADAETVFNKRASEVWPELIRRASLQWVYYYLLPPATLQPNS